MNKSGKLITENAELLIYLDGKLHITILGGIKLTGLDRYFLNNEEDTNPSKTKYAENAINAVTTSKAFGCRIVWKNSYLKYLVARVNFL